MTATLNTLAPIVLDALWQSTLVGAALVAVVLLLRATLRDRIPPGLRGVLWTLVLARLLIPIAPEFRYSIVAVPMPPSLASNPARPAVNPGSSALAPRTLQTDSSPRPVALGHTLRPSRPDVIDAPTLSPLSIAMLVHLAGVLVSASLLVVGVLRSARLARRATQLADQPSVEALEAAKADFDLSGPIMLAQSPDCPTPVVVGMLRPVILLPRGLAAQLSPNQMRTLLLHELAHVKRRDILLAWLWSFTCVIHWFNPLVHLAAHCVRVDREPACDRLALSRLMPKQAPDYGRTLLDLVAAVASPTHPGHRAPPVHIQAAVAEAFTARSSTFEGRIRMIASYRPSRPRPLAAAMLALALGVIALLTFTRTPAVAQPATREFNHFTYTFSGYDVQKDDLASVGPGAKIEVLWRDERTIKGMPSASDEAMSRLAIVVRDADRVPFVARLLDQDAINLRASLAQAIASRNSDLTNPKLKPQLKPEPEGLEFRMSKGRLQPGEDGVSPFTIGRCYTHPTSDGQPHLTIQITFETVISGGYTAWAAEAKMPVSTAQKLLAEIESSMAKRNITLPPLPPPATAKSIRQAARTDLKYAFNLGGGLSVKERWIVPSGATTANVVAAGTGDTVRVQFFDPQRRDMADEAVVDFALTKPEAKALFTSLLAAVDAPFDVDAWAKAASERLKKTPEEIVKGIREEEAARTGAICLNVNRNNLQFVANRPPYADPSQVLTAHPRGSLDLTRVCLMLSSDPTAKTSQNCTMIAYLTLDSARALARDGLKASE